MSDAGQTRDRGMVGRAPWIAGLIFALAAAVCFASIPSLARLAYDGGSDPLTVAFLRSLMGSLALVMMILIFRRPILLPRRAWPLTFLATLSWFVTNVSYLAAVFYLPVGLACLLLYCFPFVAAALLPLSGAGGLGARGFGAGLLALVGLGLAVATVYGELDPQGLLFALLAAAGASITVLVSRRLAGLHDVFSITVYVNLGGALLLAGALVPLGGFSLPYAFTGWAGLVGASAFYAVAIVVQFAAMGLSCPGRLGPRLGPRLGLVSYAEPLLTIAIAAVVLGELLAPVQFLGALLVTAALVLLAWQPQADPQRQGKVATTSRD